MGKTNKPQPPLSLEQRRAWLIEHRHPAVDPFWRLNDEPPARTVTVTLRGDRDLPEIIDKGVKKAARWRTKHARNAKSLKDSERLREKGAP